MSSSVFQSPAKYIQGKNLLSEIGQHVSYIGKRPLLTADQTVWDLTKEKVTKSFKQTGTEFDFALFGGESSRKEIDRLTNEGQKNDFVIGLGGGKTLDAAKATADKLGVPIVIVPTTASTDAPTSALSVIYTEEGAFESYKFYSRNPDLVLVDTQVIVNAPVRLFASGMADAMATLVEAKASMKSGSLTMAGGKATIAAQAITEVCEDILFTHGEAAFRAVEKHLVTPQVEAVIEANTLLSGLGFENGGLAAAHAIHNGFTALDGPIHHLTHGEKVAYGILVQLVLENRTFDEIDLYLTFFRAIHMPVTLEELHLQDAAYEDLLKVGTLAVSENETLKNLSPDITAEDVADAILAVDLLSGKPKKTY